jgi:starch phosphorylase
LKASLAGVTGWAIGPEKRSEDNGVHETQTRCTKKLYEKLERVIIPMFHDDRSRFTGIMRHAIAVKAHFLILSGCSSNTC